MTGVALARTKTPYKRFPASGRASWNARNRRNTALSGNLHSLGVDAHCIKDGVAIESKVQSMIQFSDCLAA